MHIEPFTITLAESILTDLRTRIHNTRWPDPAPGDVWEQGTDLDYLRELLKYWSDEFDWRVQEQKPNTFHHYHAEVV